jgi:hypothetical protein
MLVRVPKGYAALFAAYPFGTGQLISDRSHKTIDGKILRASRG